jgi:hypothetical protein
MCNHEHSCIQMRTHACICFPHLLQKEKSIRNSFFISSFLHYSIIHFYIYLFCLILISDKILWESSISGFCFTTLDDIATSYILLKAITFDKGNLLGRRFAWGEPQKMTNGVFVPMGYHQWWTNGPRGGLHMTYVVTPIKYEQGTMYPY